MNKLSATLPIMGLLVFGGVYWNHALDHQARLAAQQRQHELAWEEKVRLETAARTRAHQDALAAQMRRGEERTARERLESQRKQALADAAQHRAHAVEQEKKLQAQRTGLRADLHAAQAALTRLEERQAELREEHLFLLECVRQAQDNRDAFRALLEKIAAREQSSKPPAEPQLRASRRHD